MRFAAEGWTSLRITALAGVILICGYAVVQWMGYFNGGPGEAATRPPLTPGVVDPLNRAILIEGGTFISGSDDWDTIVAPGSPYSKRDEYPRPRTVPSFWMQEHEVTNEEYRRFDAGHAFRAGRSAIRSSMSPGGKPWPTPSPLVEFCQPKHSGSSRREARRDGSTRGATRSLRATGYTTVPATRGARSR